MDNDDRQIGRVLRRRVGLALFGAVGGAAVVGFGRQTLAGAGSASDLVARFLARTSDGLGPGNARVRRAPRADRGPVLRRRAARPLGHPLRPVRRQRAARVPLQLAFHVSHVAGGACAPLAGAMVDLWHCDALGVYSDVHDPGGSTLGQKFLRGYQTTDGDGQAGSRRSTRAGTRAARCTSTSRSAPRRRGP